MRRIERVVEIEHPLGDVSEGRSDHVLSLGRSGRIFNAAIDQGGVWRLDRSELGDKIAYAFTQAVQQRRLQPYSRSN